MASPNLDAPAGRRSPGKAALAIHRRDVDAAIFDLDGVLTDTARIHASAWKRVFDAFLRRRAERLGHEFQPFDIETDYVAHVDGRPRHDGVRGFLAARGIALPEGTEHDHEEAETVHAIGKHKTRLFRRALERGIDPAPGAQALLTNLRQAGIAIAVGSSSKNCAAILRAARLDHLIDASVDGTDVDKLGLPGKPDPALYLEAARRLGVTPSRAVLFEDSLAGVESGRRGGFCSVIGVVRGRRAKALLAHGADVLVESLLEVEVAAA